MRLTSKLLGAGIIVTSTALAGCNCCDSGNRQMASKQQTPTSSQQMAYGQRPAAGSPTWSNQGGQSSQNQVVQTNGTGQPGSGMQQAGWSNSSATTGRTMSGNMSSQTAPAIPVTPTQTTAGNSSGYGSGAYGSPASTGGAYGSTRSAATTGGAYGTTPGAYQAPTTPRNLNLGGQPTSPMSTTPSSGMNTGSSAPSTSMPSTGMGSGGAMAPSTTSPVADASGMGRTSGSSMSGSPAASTTSLGSSQTYMVPGSSASGQPATAPTDPGASLLSGGSSTSTPVSGAKGGSSN